MGDTSHLAAAQPLVVVGGEALVDLILRPDGSTQAVLGGGPYNTARAIARLGGNVAFAAALSEDGFGRRLRQGLVDDGVSMALIQTSNLPTTMALAELDEHGSASYHFYFEGTSAPSHVSVPTVDPAALHIGTLGLVLEPMASTLAVMVERAGSHCLVMIDANSRPSATFDPPAYVVRLQQVCRRAHVLKVSTDDLAFIGQHANMVTADDLLSWGPQVVLLTDGGNGVDIVTRSGSVHVDAAPVEVVDSIGAGDSFGGAFVAWWLGHGLSVADLDDPAKLFEAVSMAARVAAITCTRAGADPPTAAEVPGW